MKPTGEKYLGYVVAIDNPLSYHIHIYWPADVESRYAPYARSYRYEYASEELDDDYYEGRAYICRLNNVNTAPSEDYSTTKVAYQVVSSSFRQHNNWIYVQVGDIDSYSRILVDISDVMTNESLVKRLFSVTTDKGASVIVPYERPKRVSFTASGFDMSAIAHRIK